MSYSGINKKVFDKISEGEVKLSSENIELGAIQDLQKADKALLLAVKNADKAWRTYQDYLTNASKPFNIMINAYNDLEKLWQPANNVLTRVENASKELGVKPSEIDGYNSVFENLKTAKNILSVISSFGDPSKFQ